MPDHCQRKALYAAGTHLPWEESAPTRITHGREADGKAGGSKPQRPELQTGTARTPEELSRLRAIAATGKFDDEGVDGGQPLSPDVPMTDASVGAMSGGEKIGVCARVFLEKVFKDTGIDVSKIRIHTDGIPAAVEMLNTVKNGVLAVTVGYDIYFAKGKYDPLSNVGISKIAHEVDHVKQYSDLGYTGFAREYIRSYTENLKSYVNARDLKNLRESFDELTSPTVEIAGTKVAAAARFSSAVTSLQKSVNPDRLNQAYENVTLEKEAYEVEGGVYDYLQTNFPDGMCK